MSWHDNRSAVNEEYQWISVNISEYQWISVNISEWSSVVVLWYKSTEDVNTIQEINLRVTSKCFNFWQLKLFKGVIMLQIRHRTFEREQSH